MGRTTTNGRKPQSTNGHKTAILYARVSTDEQAERGYSLDTQLEAMRAYAERHGMVVVAELREDYTGAKLDRPELDRARAMLARGEANVFVVYASDRLTRSLAHLLVLREEFAQAGVELHTVNRGRSENTPEGNLIENVEGLFSEFWRGKILEGVKRGKVGKALAGKWIGGVAAPYGYRGEGTKGSTRLVVDDAAAEVVRLIYTLSVAGDGDSAPMSDYAIVRYLNERGVPAPGRRGKGGTRWNPATVGNILRNRTYLGEWVYRGNGQQVVVKVPAIIEPWLFEEAQARRAENKRLSPRNTKREYLLRGRLTCVCGRSMVGACVGGKRNPGYRLYRCASVGHWQASQCHGSNVNADLIEREAWAWVYGLLRDPQTRLEGLREMQREAEAQAAPLRRRIAIVERQLKKCDDELQALVEGLLDKAMDKRQPVSRGLAALRQAAEAKAAEVTERQAVLRGELERLQAQVRGLVVTDAEIAETEALFAKAGELLADYALGLDHATYDDKARTFALLRVAGHLVDTPQGRAVLLTCRRPGATFLVNLNKIDNYQKY